MKTILITIITGLLTYLGLVFLAWDFDLSGLHFSVRLFALVIWACLIMIILDHYEYIP
jgi:hypothetical protein